MSDRIGVMNDGQLLQVDDPQQLYEHPKSRFVANFIGEINLLDGTVADPTTVALTGGTKVRAAVDRPAGHAVTIAIRPERLGLDAAAHAPAAGLNSIEGTVARRIYHGDVYFYTVDTAAGKVDVKEENRPSVIRHDEGDRVHVSWDPTATSVIED